MRRNVKFTLVLGLLVGCAVAVFADTKKAQDIDAEQKKFRELADVALREGKWETAIKMYTQSLLLRPNWSDYFKRATAYSAGVNTAFAAFSDLSNALKEKPDLNQARSRRAKLGLTLGLLDQAKQDYEYLQTATPNDDTVQPQLHLIAQLEQQIIHAKGLIQSKQWQFARDLLTQILESCPSSLELRLLRAEAFFNLGDFNSVSDDATRVWKLQGSNVAAQYWKGRAAFYLGDQDGAIKAFREALKSDPEDRMTKDEMKRVTKFTRALKAAEEHAAQRKWTEMIAEYQNLPAFDPLPSHYFQKVYLSLCKAQVALKNYDKALEECTKSVDNGGGWEALVERGQAHEDAQQYQKAVADYQHALELSNRQDVHQKLLNAQRLLKMAKRKDYYKILGVEKNAAQQEIKKAHRKLALQWHPDKHPADKKEEAQKVYTEITEAWEVLGDSEKRGKYDRGEDMEEQPMHHHHGGGFPFGFGGPGGPGGPGGFTFSFNFGGR